MQILSLEELARQIPDGATVAVGPDYSGVAMAATRALIRRGARDLTLVTLPTSGLQADLLVGAGALKAIETSAVALGEAGAGPRFAAAAKAGTLTIRDATCPAIHAALQAAEKGVPFMPLRGVIGSDLIRMRDDWKVVDNPLGDGGDPILLVPAIRPDIALFHAPFADEAGNVWVGRRRELFTLAHAAAGSLVTVEEVRPGNLLDDELLAPAVITSLYVQGIAVAPRGAWPLKFGERYPEDTAHLAEYLRLAATAEGFQTYLERWVLGPEGRR